MRNDLTHQGQLTAIPKKNPTSGRSFSGPFLNWPIRVQYLTIRDTKHLLTLIKEIRIFLWYLGNLHLHVIVGCFLGVFWWDLGNIWLIYGQYLGNIWDIFVWYSGDFWVIFWRCLGAIWTIFGRYLGDLRAIYGNILVIFCWFSDDILDIFGGYLD